MTQLISLFDVEPIFPQLAGGQLILTPNQRLASRISKAYALFCQKKGNQVVVSPQVYSFNHWLERCWQQLLINGHDAAISSKPLTLNHELFIWEQILSSSVLGAVLLRPSATAKVVASAYRLLVDWQQDLQSNTVRELFLADQDSAALLNWIDQFEQYCRDKHYIPRARIPELILSAFDDVVLTHCGDILGIGFEEMPPLHKRLVSKAGNFKPYLNSAKAGEVAVLSCDTFKDELTSAAVWSKQILKHDPKAIVAIVVPELSQQRHLVERLFLEVYDPAFNQPLASDNQPAVRRNLPFNISAGYPLLDAAVITAALNALSLLLKNLEMETLISICQSPFYSLDSSDRDKSEQLIILLHKQCEQHISTARFRQLAHKVSLQDSPQQSEQDSVQTEWHFSIALQQMATTIPPSLLDKLRPIDDWIDLFNQLLQIIGWPGKRRLDSIEFQQVTQWQQALHALSTQSLVMDSISYGDALRQLRSNLSNSIFQAQTQDSRLQILGTLEAAGLQFDHLWLTSMSERQWPPAPSPNPLLPFTLQRQQAMPHATAERELNYAKKLTNGFIHCAKKIVISSPTIIDDNPASVSSLFSHYPPITLHKLLGRPLDHLLPAKEILRRHIESCKLEVFDASTAPRLTENEKISGGSSLFSSQSACPFKSFLSHRLNLIPLSTVECGLSAAERGSLLHRALEFIWQKLKCQKNLMQLDESDLERLCEEVSRYCLDELSQSRPKIIGQRYKQLEIIRLKKLIKAWLTIESTRANFKISSLEDKKNFQFSGLKLQARIDRIDRLDDGSLLIIDYKTGQTNINRWWGNRPDEPQLPLYSLLTETEQDTVGGIAFAKVRSDGCNLSGVGAENLPEQSVSWQSKHQTDSGATDWIQLKQHWHKVLTALADDFISGKADVDPKSPLQSCQYCHFASACRINHQQSASL